MIHNMGMHCGQGGQALGWMLNSGEVESRCNCNSTGLLSRSAVGADHREGGRSLKAQIGMASLTVGATSSTAECCRCRRHPMSHRPRRAQYAFIVNKNAIDRNTKEF